MKKAKEFAEEILEFERGSEEYLTAVAKAVSEMISEVGELVEARNIVKKSALDAIVKEQDRKWKAVCRLTDNEVQRELFKQSLYELCPTIKRELDYMRR